MYSWAENTGMQFNAEKFELLRFWVDRDSAPDFYYLVPGGGKIEEKDSLRDLGVRVSRSQILLSDRPSCVFCQQHGWLGPLHLSREGEILDANYSPIPSPAKTGLL